MPVSVGSRLGLYEILAHIGAGGMGEVYKARDTRLDRSVALKVIREELLEQNETLLRFEREARTLAALNHPRIATIYGLEESGGIKFLTLEYVPGPTLADRLRRGPLPIQQVLLIGKQIAEALEAAHAKGIIHRDLKPANIKMSEDGQAKVLDFGLAKSFGRRQVTDQADATATITEELTRQMTVVGTAAYMSPEQACGKELDPRTDIWSFGCVLYEALAARQAFRGRTITEILAAVIERDPDWSALPAATPTAVKSLLKRCLRKEPQARLRDIGDARIELEDLLAAPAQADPVRKQSAITRRTAISALSGVAAGAAVTPGAMWPSTPISRPVARFNIQLPPDEALYPSNSGFLAMSSNGRRIASTAVCAK